MNTITQHTKTRLIEALIRHANWHRDNCNSTCNVSLSELRDACNVVMSHQIDYDTYNYLESIRLRKLIDDTNWL